MVKRYIREIWSLPTYVLKKRNTFTLITYHKLSCQFGDETKTTITTPPNTQQSIITTHHNEPIIDRVLTNNRGHSIQPLHEVLRRVYGLTLPGDSEEGNDVALVDCHHRHHHQEEARGQADARPWVDLPSVITCVGHKVCLVASIPRTCYFSLNVCNLRWYCAWLLTFGKRNKFYWQLSSIGQRVFSWIITNEYIHAYDSVYNLW